MFLCLHSFTSHQRRFTYSWCFHNWVWRRNWILIKHNEVKWWSRDSWRNTELGLWGVGWVWGPFLNSVHGGYFTYFVFKWWSFHVLAAPGQTATVLQVSTIAVFTEYEHSLTQSSTWGKGTEVAAGKNLWNIGAVEGNCLTCFAIDAWRMN